MAEYKYNKDACQQDRPKGVTHMMRAVQEMMGKKGIMGR